jgi:hypothetical protein
MALRFFADHCVSNLIIQSLAAGHEVLRSAAAGGILTQMVLSRTFDETFANLGIKLPDRKT